MKKSFLWLCAIVLILAGCKTKDNGINVPTDAIVGKWKLTTLDGKQIPTNQCIVYTFNDNGTGTQTTTDFVQDIGERIWYVQQRLKYTLNKNALHTQWSQSAVVLEWMATVSSVSNDEMVTDLSRWFINTEPQYDMPKATWKRVTADYDSEIIGMWEGVSSSGDTKGDYNHRWLFTPEGKYYYYSKTEDGRWVVSENALNEYALDGDFLAFRWKTDESAAEDREWWDVSMSNQGLERFMTWSALREDENGNTFTSVMTMKRISVPAQDIMKYLPGKWIAKTEDGQPILTDRKSVHTFDTEGLVQYTVASHSADETSWHNRLVLNYSLYGAYMVEKGYDIDGTLTQWRSVFGQMDNQSLTVYSFTGQRTGELTLEKVNVDYADAIIGLWEGVDMSGDETYGDANHHWEYKADGTYVYYIYEDDTWKPKEQEGSYYMVDGNWMATRWIDADTHETMYEWWDLTIETQGGEEYMNWYGLREDETGKRFENRMRLHRIN